MTVAVVARPSIKLDEKAFLSLVDSAYKSGNRAFFSSRYNWKQCFSAGNNSYPLLSIIFDYAISKGLDATHQELYDIGEMVGQAIIWKYCPGFNFDQLFNNSADANAMIFSIWQSILPYTTMPNDIKSRTIGKVLRKLRECPEYNMGWEVKAVTTYYTQKVPYALYFSPSGAYTEAVMETLKEKFLTTGSDSVYRLFEIIAKDPARIGQWK